MTIAITCTCSARLEVDEKFIGQQITCPDCQAALKVPEATQEAVRTSAYALASVVLAIVGAVTLVGTMAAVLLGALALVHINSNPGKLAGKNLAWTGIILGMAFTGLSVFAFYSPELFGLDPVLRQTRWIGKLDYPPDLEIRKPNEGFSIKRPSPQWGVLKSNRNFRPWERWKQDFLMVNPNKSAYVLVLPEDVGPDASFESCVDRGKQVFQQSELSGNSLTRGNQDGVKIEFDKTANRRFRKGDTQLLEMRLDKTFRGKTRSFVLRVAKKDNDNIIYVVAGGADKSRFADLESELREAVDSFRIIERDLPPNNFGPMFP